MRYSKVEGHINLIRDEHTKAILNTNMSDYESYMNLKKSKELESNRIDKLESNIVSIQSDLDEIKSLLRSFINESK